MTKMDFNTDSVSTWTTSLESYLKTLGENSLCLSVLHQQSEEHYSRLSIFIDLPVIILSTLCGSLTLSAKNMFGEELENDALKIVGGLSLFTAILGTVQSYFSFNRAAENHRISQIQYSQLYRFIKVQLGLPRAQRLPAKDLLKVTMQSFERLSETSNLISKKIAEDFKKKYKKEQNISRPSVVNGLETIKIHKEQKIDEDIIEVNEENIEEDIIEVKEEDIE